MHIIMINIPVLSQTRKLFQVKTNGINLRKKFAMYSHTIKIPSHESIMYFESGKFSSLIKAPTDAMTNANEKYNGANRFRTNPIRGTLPNVYET